MQPRRIVGRLTLSGQRGGFDPSAPIMQSARGRGVSLDLYVCDDGTIGALDRDLAAVCMHSVEAFARAADTLETHPIHALDERGQRVTIRPIEWLAELLRDGCTQPGRGMLAPLRALPVPVRTMSAPPLRTR